MATIKSYMEGKQLKFRVSIGRKTFKGFTRPSDALKRGIEAAQAEMPQIAELLSGKPFDRQVGIVFGAEIKEQYAESLV